MSLFVGNISKHVKSYQLEDEFNRFGSCDIKRHVRFLNSDIKPRFMQAYTPIYKLTCMAKSLLHLPFVSLRTNTLTM